MMNAFHPSKSPKDWEAMSQLAVVMIKIPA